MNSSGRIGNLRKSKHNGPAAEANRTTYRHDAQGERPTGAKIGQMPGASSQLRTQVSGRAITAADTLRKLDNKPSVAIALHQLMFQHVSVLGQSLSAIRLRII